MRNQCLSKRLAVLAAILLVPSICSAQATKEDAQALLAAVNIEFTDSVTFYKQCKGEWEAAANYYFFAQSVYEECKKQAGGNMQKLMALQQCLDSLQKANNHLLIGGAAGNSAWGYLSTAQSELIYADQCIVLEKYDDSVGWSKSALTNSYSAKSASHQMSMQATEANTDTEAALKSLSIFFQ